ncbi:50S ribosomal protein L6 [Patescibacteria group bacterium]|nr:50S ribosomal protein L6 [Patescibacteria group bacterium]
MSRVGKKPIELVDGVDIALIGSTVNIKGPRGELIINVDQNITLKIEDKTVLVEIKKDNKEARELHGLTRSLIANMIKGVSEGFEKKLEFTGVGYRAAVEGGDLVLNLGYSHPIRYTPKEGVKIEAEKNTITVSGIDKQIVGQVAAEIRAFRKPEPYKGKGIRYQDEKIRRKAGKTAAKGSE